MERQRMIRTEVESFSEIGNFIIPSFQRRLDRKRVNEIAEHIKEKRKLKQISFLGSISIAIFEENTYIIDGQHRYEAYRKDYERYGENETIYLEGYRLESQDEMLEFFRTRGLGHEFARYVLHSSNDRNRALMEKIEEYISDKPGFSNSPGTRRPNINTLQFLNDIHDENVLEEFELNTFEDFKRFLKQKNNLIRDSINDGMYKTERLSDSMVGKAESNGNYLGLLRNKKWFNFE